MMLLVMEKKSIAIIAVAAVILVVASSAAVIVLSNNNSAPLESGDHLDAAGNEIKKLDKVESIACVGANTLRIVSYLGATEKVKIVSSSVVTGYTMPFMYAASDDVKNMKTFHGGGTFDSTDVAYMIDDLKIDVLFLAQSRYDAQPNEVKSLVDAGVSVVVMDSTTYEFVNPETLKLDSTFTNVIYDFAYAINEEKRANDFINGANDLISEIHGLTAGKTPKSAYVGCISFDGNHPLDTSIWSYVPFLIAGVNNVLPKGIISGNQTVSVQAYTAADLDKWTDENTIIFVDAGGYSQLNEAISKGLVQLWQDNKAYILPPFVASGMNFENGFVGACEVIRYVYGDEVLNETQFKELLDKVYDVFHETHISARHVAAYGVDPQPEGTHIYDDYAYVLKNKNGVPIYGELDFKSDGTVEIL